MIVGAASSLTIVPVAVPVAIVALLGADKSTVKVSVFSKTVSPMIGTFIVWLVTSGANVRTTWAVVNSLSSSDTRQMW